MCFFLSEAFSLAITDVTETNSVNNNAKDVAHTTYSSVKLE